MANPPITIGQFDNVPAPGSPIRSAWPQEISTVVNGLGVVRSGLSFLSTDAAGLVRVPYGYNYPTIPPAVSIMNGDPSHSHIYIAQTMETSGFYMFVRQATTAAPVANTAIAVRWIVFGPAPLT